MAPVFGDRGGQISVVIIIIIIIIIIILTIQMHSKKIERRLHKTAISWREALVGQRIWPSKSSGEKV